MNKKRLSVVMAGAMLATSVAPVLAATESEVDTSRLGGLVEKVKDQLLSKVFDKDDENVALRNKSAYYVKINGKDAEVNGTLIRTMELKNDADKEALRDALQEAFKNLKAGDKVEIFSEGFREEGGKVFSTTNSTEVTYGKTELTATATDVDGKSQINATTKEIEKNLREAGTNLIPATGNYVRIVGGKIRVYFGTTTTPTTIEGFVLNTDSSNAHKYIELDENTKVRDFSKYIDATTEEVKAITASTTHSNIKGFPVKYATSADIKGDELIETIKITGTTYNYKAEDLYDGLMFTTEGHKMLSLVKETKAQIKAGVQNVSLSFETLDNAKYPFANYVSGTGKYGTEVELPKINNEYGFVVRIKDAFGKERLYTVKGTEKYANVVATWLYNELARVDILAGDNRYETAVEIAKEQALLVGPAYGDNTNTIDNIVLVNGNSLVDGLSASPLAAHLTAGSGNFARIAAPVLLSESDKLPKATRAYLKELQANRKVGGPKAEIHLVGGTAVLNVSLEKELEDLGFKVVRYNGANREATSLKIAEAISVGNDFDEVFVVGAEGEADAMSIAGVASRNVNPIIVSKKGGLTYDALKKLEGEKVTVVGGKVAVSEADYEAIKEEAKAIRRIEGANRQATNAAVIKEFYHGDYLVDNTNGIASSEVTSVIVAKDGRANKTQLVDALAAANLGVQFNAPIVLATNSLSADQIDALQLRAKSAKSLYQVGHGVERSVMETVASKLGLLNK